MITLTDPNLTGYVRMTSFMIRHWLRPWLWHDWKKTPSAWTLCANSWLGHNFIQDYSMRLTQPAIQLQLKVSLIHSHKRIANIRNEFFWIPDFIWPFKLWKTYTNLFSALVSVASWPEKVGTNADCTALVGFLQQFGGSQSALGTQGLMVLFAEAPCTLKRANDQSYCGQLSLWVADLVFIQGECLETHMQKWKVTFLELMCWGVRMSQC